VSVRIDAPRFNAASGSGEVSAIAVVPDEAAALLVLAHGAGAGMTHPFMEKVASLLAEDKIATFRFNFPYMEKRKKVPDVPAVAMKTVESAVYAASKFSGKLPLFAGGKSFGGRMTSQAAASGMIPSMKGIVFFSFPLHPPGKPGIERASHLYNVKTPMLFLQGTRDALADISLMRQLTGNLGEKAALHEVTGGDHSFHVSKDKDESVLKEICSLSAEWMKKQIS
jgi:hypothetical protein